MDCLQPVTSAMCVTIFSVLVLIILLNLQLSVQSLIPSSPTVALMVQSHSTSCV